jgi:DNA-binding beta-propeller fold protein YncE
MPLGELELSGPPQVLGALAGLGRTEDLQFSPDNRRLAIAGFGRHRVFLVDLDLDHDLGVRGGPVSVTVSVAVTGLVELGSPSLCEPHGLCFLDDRTLVVANRGGEAPIFSLPPPVCGLRQLEVEPVATICAGVADGVATPGSVEAWPLAPGLYEVVICNNYANNVSRHLVDDRDRCRVLGSEVLLAAGLDVPDGVSVSSDRRWLAVSNHNTHSVLVFRCSPDLAPSAQAHGKLRGVTYPHGLRFTKDGRHLVVADAGAPYVHVFAAPGGDWRGDHDPISTLEVMDAETFQRGRYNPQEGGPKGLDIDRTSRVVAVTSEHQPLALFDAREVLTAARQPPSGCGSRGDGGNEATRNAILRDVARIARLERSLATRDEELAELAAAVRALEASAGELAADLESARAEAQALGRLAENRDQQLTALLRSTSWRATALPRWVGARLRRGAAHPG